MKNLLKALIKPETITIYIFSIAHLTHDIFTSFLAPITPLLIKKHGLTLTQVGLFALALRIPTIANPLIGLLADKTNPRLMLVIPITVSAITMTLIGNASSFYVILILLFLTGISSACFHVPAPVLLSQLVTKNRGAGMSSFQIGGELSRSLGPLLILAVVSSVGLNNIFILIPFAFAISIILFFRLKKNIKFTKKQNPTKFSYVEIIKESKFLFIGIFGILITKSFIASTMASYLPIYLTEQGKSLWMAGSSLSILFIAAMFGVFFTGVISDYIGRIKTLIIFSILSPLSMLYFLKSESTHMIIALIMVGFCAFSTTPVILALIQDQKLKFPSVTNGIFMTMNFMTSSLAIFFFGKIADNIGQNSTFHLFTLISFSGIPLIFILTKHKKSLKKS